MIFRAILIGFALLANAAAQNVLTAPRPPEALGATERKTAREAASVALRDKNFAEARRHLEWLLWWDPVDPALWRDLASAQGSDVEAALFYAHLAAHAAADERGGLPTGAVAPEHLALDPFIKSIPAARAAAAKELAAFSKAAKSKLGPDGGANLAAILARAAMREVTTPMPALLRAQAKALNEATACTPPDWKKVVAGLEETIAAALSSSQPETAIAAAQALAGLARQAGFKDLKGPKAPDLKAKGEVAAAAIERARQMIDKKAGGPVTIEALEAMSEEEALAFTRAHASWANPGVAMSPSGLYRVETVCGHATLLGVASTVELHHRRLARFFGADPFVGRTGIVRVVPEASGLESEGAPYWWAGGFQRGDVTTVRFSVGSIEGLGHGLTHELTHRFDGGLLPFQSAWLVEGKAVWTGAAYGKATDEDFVPNHASYGTIESAFIKGYGAKENLEKLVKGTIDDYRDNYSAGYALYVFLTTWEADGKKPFASRFQTYVKDAMKGRSKPLDWFEANFVDGKDGRPEKLEEFAKVFQEFLRGFYWLSRADWVERYTQAVPKGASHDLVYDTPTWVFSRARSEPYFGQDQAFAAATVLAAEKRPPAAVEAFLWALEVDEWGERITAPFGRLLDGMQKTASRRLLTAVDRNRRPWAYGAAIDPGPFEAELRQTSALIDTLLAAARSHREKNREALALHFEAAAGRLAFLIGQERPARAALPPRLLKAPARDLWLHGLAEDGLHGYEEHRAVGLWARTPDGDLLVGREAPKEGSGEFDRTANRRDAYARTEEWIAAGRYRLSMRVGFTTAYANGDVIFGSSRRDRNLRFSFSAGDYMYAIGQSKTEPKFDAVSWDLSGLRDRDGALRSAPGGREKFKAPKANFDLELLIDGADVEAYLDGRFMAAYRSPDGLPIEGHVGVAMSFGAVRVSRATIERLDGLPPEPATAAFDLAAERSAPLNRLIHRTAHGVPIAPAGTLLVFVPAVPLEDGKAPIDVPATLRTAVDTAAQVLTARDGDQLPQRVVVAVPSAIDEAGRARVREQLATAGWKDIDVLSHRRTTPLANDDMSSLAASFPTLVFVDPVAGFRVAEMPLSRRLPDQIRHWCRVFRDADRFHP